METLDEATISLNLMSIPFFSSPVLSLIFPSPAQMSQKNREKKDVTFLKAITVVAGLLVACVTCGM